MNCNVLPLDSQASKARDALKTQSDDKGETFGRLCRCERQHFGRQLSVTDVPRHAFTRPHRLLEDQKVPGEVEEKTHRGIAANEAKIPP